MSNSYSCHEHQCCLLPKTTTTTTMATATKISSVMKTKKKSKFLSSSVSTSRRIKNILKPVIGKIFKSKYHKQNKSNTYISSSMASTTSTTSSYYFDDNYNDFDDDHYDDIGWWKSERLQNEANEELEERLIEEIQNSPDDAAIFIFNDRGRKDLRPINKEKFYVPVHFARTNAGTFFWTSAQKQIITDPFKIEWHFLDRWAQA